MPPHPCHWATPHPCCQATPRHHHWATTHPDLWHLLGWRLTWTKIVSFRLHLYQQKMVKSDWSEIELANYVLSFCNWAMGTMSENVYNNPHQELCVGRMLGGSLSKNVTLHKRRMQGESAQILSNRLAISTLFRGESWWSNFLPTAQQVLPE